MRNIVVLSFLTLDGVMQAPGGPEEDMSGGFEYGGWTVPYFDEYAGTVMDEQMGHPFDLLLGRKTYDIFSAYWPNHPEDLGGVFNGVTKYVASTTLQNPSWENTIVLGEDVVEQLRTLKESDGPELQVHGSGNFAQTLFKHDLVDELWLKIFPIMLGQGKRLFDTGTIPAAFTLQSSSHSPSGVLFANYRRAGDVQTGSF